MSVLFRLTTEQKLFQLPGSELLAPLVKRATDAAAAVDDAVTDPGFVAVAEDLTGANTIGDVAAEIDQVVVVGTDIQLGTASKVLKVATDLLLGATSKIAIVAADLLLGAASKVLAVGTDLLLGALSKITIAADNIDAIIAAPDAADRAEAAAEAVDSAFAELKVYGATGMPDTVTPIDGSVTLAGLYLHGEVLSEDRTYRSARGYNKTSGAKTCTVKRFKLNVGGTAWDFVTGSATVTFVTPSAIGAYDVDLSAPLYAEAGEVLVTVNPANAFTAAAGTPFGPGYVYYSTSAATSIPVAALATTSRYYLGLDYDFQYVTADKVNAIAIGADDGTASANALLRPGHTGRKPGTTTTGASLAAGQSYAFPLPIPRERRYYQIRVYNGAATTQTFYVRTYLDDGTNVALSGDEIPITVPDTIGWHTIPVDFTMPAGAREGLRPLAAGSLWYQNSVTEYGGGYHAHFGNSFASGAALSGTFKFLVGFDWYEIDQPDALVSIDLFNVARIGVVGDSYTQDGRVLKDKSWIAEWSAMSDFNIENYGVGGNKVSDMITRIRSNAMSFGSLGFQDYRTAYAPIMSGTNDQNAGVTVPNFQEGLREAAETVSGLGAIPIIASQHLDRWGAGTSMIYKQSAEQSNAGFINVNPLAKLVGAGPGYAGHWLDLHPGTRTNKFFSQAYHRYFQGRDRPDSSVKIFRPRPGLTVSTVADLFYQDSQDNYDRCLRWKEITIGHYSLTTATEKYYDEVASSVLVQNLSEYLKIMDGQPVAFTDYALVEFVLPTTPPHMGSAQIVFDNIAEDAVYIPDNMGGTVANDTPVGAWIQLTGSAGVYSIPERYLKNGMRFDKLPVLIAKSGAFSLRTSPSLRFVWDGVAKPRRIGTDLSVRGRGSELLTTTTFPTSGAPTGWTVTGTVTGASPADSVVPAGAVGLVVVSSTSYVSQAFMITADALQDREIDIRVVARRWTNIFVSATDTYPTNAGITSDTFDWAKVYVGLAQTAPAAFQWRAVSTGWMELAYRATVPAGATSVTLTIKASEAVQISGASVKFLNP